MRGRKGGRERTLASAEYMRDGNSASTAAGVTMSSPPKSAVKPRGGEGGRGTGGTHANYIIHRFHRGGVWGCTRVHGSVLATYAWWRLADAGKAAVVFDGARYLAAAPCCAKSITAIHAFPRVLCSQYVLA